jgi:hypothetical protein
MSLSQKGKIFTVEILIKDFLKMFLTYSQLLMSKEFYELFIEYDYIIIYQLDCFVFKDSLENWLYTGFDYIGAPWVDGVKKTAFRLAPLYMLMLYKR